MAVYRLEGLLAEAFEAVRGPFAAALGHEVRLRLGGGTALALRWGHRQSTDLDFFVDPGDYGRAHARVRELAEELEARGVRDVTVGPDPGVLCEVGGRTEVTLFPAYPVTSRPLSSDTVEGSRVRLESSAEILAKKLVWRVGSPEVGSGVRRTALARDVYDLAYASRHRRAEFEAAVAGVPLNVLELAFRRLRGATSAEIAREGRPLVGMEDESLESGGRDIIVAALDRHLRERLPPLPPLSGER